MPTRYYGGNSSNFFPKIFPEFFFEYFIHAIEPPFGVTKCHIWGGYGGGEGSICQDPHIGGGMPNSQGPPTSY